jgi:glycosyltransferase involved in cell wall biosynthesis
MEKHSRANWKNGFMPDEPQLILQINTRDGRGGAAEVARNLHRAFRERGLDARMAVGSKSGDDPNITTILNEEARPWLCRILLTGGSKLRTCGAAPPAVALTRRALHFAGDPERYWAMYRGLENFSYPGTWRVLDLAGLRPSIIHCHNLHSGYFDLRALPWLSGVAPLVITLHDAWLLSGHCAHSFSCGRWRHGCGTCPDLNIPPALTRDGTAANWKRKRRILQRSHLYVIAPSRWIMEQAQQSILAPAIRGARIIPNGVDLQIFRPRDKVRARLDLGLPLAARIACFVAEGARSNPFKDWRTQAAALELLAVRRSGRGLLYLAIGADGAASRVGGIEVRCVPYTADPHQMALYYQASDICVHAALAETFGLVIAEALACGTPVVATRTGGIPEVVRDQETGLLVDPGDAPELANAIDWLLNEPEKAAQFGANGAHDARNRFGLERQVAAHLDVYREARSAFLHRRQQGESRSPRAHALPNYR